MSIDKITTEVFNALHIKIDLSGYWYWIEAVKYVIENNKTSYSMTKEIYIHVAEEFKTTSTRVERALRTTHCNTQEIIQQYFGVNYKIDNSALLALIVDKVKSQMEE